MIEDAIESGEITVYSDIEKGSYSEDELELLWDYDEADREVSYLMSHGERSDESFYFSTAGEIEARDASQRMDYTAEQRKSTRPDIDRTDVVFAEGGVSYDYGVTQEDINNYVDAAYKKENTEDYKKYADPSEKLIADVADEIDITGYAHALRDNDIRHIRNSHGENTNEKYPVTKDDIKRIPWLIENYDKVLVVKRKDGKTGIIYVKTVEEGLVYYLEQVTTKYGNEPLLVNKQMIKTGSEDIPDLPGIEDAITKKQSVIEFLDDLKKVPKVYAQSVHQSHSVNSISNSTENVKQKGAFSLSSPNTAPKKYGNYNVYGEDVMLEGKAKPKGKAEITAPTRESIGEGKKKAITDAPIREDVNPLKNEHVKGSEAVEPVETTVIKTVEDRITAKIENSKEELSNNQMLLEESNAEFDRRIAEAQARKE